MQRPGSHQEQHPKRQIEPQAIATHDPVCGMAVSSGSEFSAQYEGRTYQFCSQKCQTAFRAAPERYRASPPEIEHVHQAPVDTLTAATEYTCPMHPEIRQIGPGSCPKCGMTLEPVIPELEEANPELKDFSQRFWWTLPLTVIVTVLAMGGHTMMLFHGITQNWIELGLTTPVVIWAGWPFYVRGVRSVIQLSPNMWTLISLGTAAAFLYSVVATLAPDAFPDSFMIDGRIGVYFEAAAVIISLTLLGQMLELKARSQTSAAIKSLLGLAPKTARRINPDGTEEDIPLTPASLAVVRSGRQ